MRYIFVTGGVVSGLGKGVTASSIGVLLKSCGYRVTSIKIGQTSISHSKLTFGISDPYLNSDAGTMSPFEHGEVFVLDDGGEVDLDLGNYERFLDLTLTKDNNLTTGKVYSSVIERERRGDYLGKTVQVVPHVTDCIQDWIERVAHIPVDGTTEQPDVCVIELGGTVGDIESMPFIEAIRQFQFRVSEDEMCVVHVSLVPSIGAIGEQKTKPTQHNVKLLRSYGINPNILAVRSQEPIADSVREKLSLFCHVRPDQIVTIHDVSNIWHVPIILEQQKIHHTICKKLNLPNADEIDMFGWKNDVAELWDTLVDKVNIVLIGKYTGLQDAYLSVIKALQHSCLQARVGLDLTWVEASHLQEECRESDPEKHSASWSALRSADGILVPGGFGNRGIEGKILAAHYARTNGIPYLGICLGMQTAVIEYARNVVGLKDATSMEFNLASPNLAIVFMPESSQTHLGGTMRLGSRVTILNTTDCLSSKLYNSSDRISERHRHRYEVNPKRVDQFESAGLHFVGRDETGTRMEIAELPASVHPFYVCVQFHPEFKSRPRRPAPLFLGFILASSKKLDTFI